MNYRTRADEFQISCRCTNHTSSTSKFWNIRDAPRMSNSGVPKLGFTLNVAVANYLKDTHGIPVVPATGNNLSMANKKFLGTEWDVMKRPGIYCNGAMITWESSDGQIKIDTKPLPEDFLKTFQTVWKQAFDQWPEESDLKKVSVGGMTKWDTVLVNPTPSEGSLLEKASQISGVDPDLKDLPTVKWLLDLEQIP